MKISPKTLTLLKSFANINQGIIIQPGNVITSAAASGEIFAKAVVEETFEDRICIFALNEFLNMFGMFKDADISVDNSDGNGTIIISEGNRKVEYVAASESTIVTLDPNKKSPNLETLASFVLSSQDLISLKKSSQYLKFDDLLFLSNGKKLCARVFDSKNPSSTKFEIELEAEVHSSFKAFVQMDHLKILDLTYNVSINERLVNLKAETTELEYWAGLSPTSVME